MPAPIHWIPIQNRHRLAQNRVLTQWFVLIKQKQPKKKYHPFSSELFVIESLICLRRLPTTVRSHIYRAKSDKMLKMMSHTFAHTMDP